MSAVSSIFWGRDFWVNLRNYLISNAIFYALTYILPKIPKGIASEIYTTLIHHNKSSYYSAFFLHVFPKASHFDLKKVFFKWMGFIFIGNNARTSLIFVDLLKGRFKFMNHMFFYLFKLIKTLCLGLVYLGLQFHGKELISGVDWKYSMRVIL